LPTRTSFPGTRGLDDGNEKLVAIRDMSYAFGDMFSFVGIGLE
jgi:hypothetical protein